MINHDTIAAISTTPGDSGIGIIRISGTEAIDIANKLYVDKKGRHTLSTYKSHTIHYGYIESNKNSIIDEIMISIMKAPNSYTCEDVVEINCHGGIRVCKNVLDCVLSNGARIADPGEFTKRAFLNGRLDLTRAEAVMDTIRAQSDLALKTSIGQLQGNLYNKLNNICSEILYEIAYIESSLDDPDSISLDGYSEELSCKLNKISKELKELIDSYDEGRIISEGINTTILGKPNAGKSSLLNLLLDEDRAIVTDIPGTTRDILTEKIKIGNVTLNVTDTAGIRETSDPIEAIGVSKAKQSIEESDLIIYICDSSDKLTTDDESIAALIKEKEIIVLLNKDDLEKQTTINDILELFSETTLSSESIIITSLIEQKGIIELKNLIQKKFYKGDIYSNNQIIINNLRHVQNLKESLQSINKVMDSIKNGMSEDFYAIDLTDSYSALARITGAEVNEDIVNEIFSKFCMGK